MLGWHSIQLMVVQVRLDEATAKAASLSAYRHTLTMMRKRAKALLGADRQRNASLQASVQTLEGEINTTRGLM